MNFFKILIVKMFLVSILFLNASCDLNKDNIENPILLNEDISILGIKANLNIKDDWFLIELEGGLINRTFFLFVNEGQIFAKHIIQENFEKLLVSDLYKYSYSSIKDSFVEDFSKSLLETKFVKAKNLVVGQEISSLYGKFIVGKIYKINLNDSVFIKSILNNGRYLFFNDNNINKYNIYKENILKKEHWCNFFGFAFLGADIKLLLNMIKPGNISNFFKSKNLLKQSLIGAGIGIGLFEIGSNLFLYLSSKLEKIVQNSNLFYMIDTYKMIPLKLDYLLKNKSNFNMEEIKIINIEFVCEFDLNKQSENDIKKIDNLLVDVDGNAIKDDFGNVACLRIVKY